MAKFKGTTKLTSGIVGKKWQHFPPSTSNNKITYNRFKARKNSSIIKKCNIKWLVTFQTNRTSFWPNRTLADISKFSHPPNRSQLLKIWEIRKKIKVLASLGCKKSVYILTCVDSTSFYFLQHLKPGQQMGQDQAPRKQRERIDSF